MPESVAHHEGSPMSIHSVGMMSSFLYFLLLCCKAMTSDENELSLNGKRYKRRSTMTDFGRL